RHLTSVAQGKLDLATRLLDFRKRGHPGGQNNRQSKPRHVQPEHWSDLGDFCFQRRGASTISNSGTASFRTALMLARSSLVIACSSAAIHFRNVCIAGSFGLAAIMPARPM